MNKSLLKFRAWDLREGLHKMYYLTGFIQYGEGWTGGDPIHKFWEIHYGNGGFNKVGDKEIVIMQITRETYSDGTPAYEGDIYYYDYEYDSDYDGDMPIVRRSSGKGIIKNTTDTYAIRKAKEEGGKVNVIGNIYANPELA